MTRAFVVSLFFGLVLAASGCSRMGGVSYLKFNPEQAKELLSRSPLPDRRAPIDTLAVDDLIPFREGVLVGQLSLDGEWGRPYYSSVLAFSADGRRIWEYPRSGDPLEVVYGTQVFGDLVVISRVEEDEGTFEALNGVTGELVLEVDFELATAACATARSAVYLDDLTVVARAWAPGSDDWTHRPEVAPIRFRCDESTILVVGDGVEVLDAATGKLVIRVQTEMPVLDVLIDKNRLVTLDAGNRVCSRFLDSSRDAWCQTLPGAVASALVPGDTQIYAVAIATDYDARDEARVTALELSRGEVKWSTGLAGRNDGNAVVSGDSVFLPTYERRPNGDRFELGQYLNVIDRENGALKLFPIEHFQSLPDPQYLIPYDGDVIVRDCAGARRMSSDGVVKWYEEGLASPACGGKVQRELQYIAGRTGESFTPEDVFWAPARDSSRFAAAVQSHQRVFSDKDKTHFDRALSISKTTNAAEMDAAFGRMNAGIGLANAISALGPALLAASNSNKQRSNYAMRYAAAQFSSNLQREHRREGRLVLSTNAWDRNLDGLMVLEPDHGQGWCIYSTIGPMRPHLYTLTLATLNGDRLFVISEGPESEHWRPVDRFYATFPAPQLLIYQLDDAEKITSGDIALECSRRPAALPSAG